MLIATLTEKFSVTAFKSFHATLEGRDTLVIHPTGSGKSLCFQFPPVFQEKRAFIITPTISLMQDQVHGLQQKGINCTFLVSAQPDEQAECKALDPKLIVTLALSLLHQNGFLSQIMCPGYRVWPRKESCLC